jgi:CheY-like chemotaxis protein
MIRARGIILIGVVLILGLRVATAAETGEGGLITRLRQQEEAQKKQAESDVRVDISDPSAAERQIESLNNSVSNAVFIAEQSKRAEEADRAVYKNTIIGLALLGIGVILVRKLAPRIGFLFNVRDETADAAPNNPEEEKSFSEFVAAFKVGPPPPARRAAFETASDGRAEPLKVGESTSVSRSPVKIFFDDAPKCVGVLRGLIQEITRAGEQTTRHKLLSALCEKISELKRMAGLPEVLPAWQLAVALEGLVKQLSDKERNVTPSTLRTVASAVDLLEALSVRGIKPDLMSEPPIRFLAVDDDSLSRHAVSFALKKALNKPDLAENGEAALALVSHIKYDAIFLDVQMPGMNGFEVCSKIHGTELNRTTPVVFVTCQSDFDARAKSTLSGGIDLIGKPFLTFEITVKALTLALRGRLNPRAEATAARQENGKAIETARTHDATPIVVEKTSAPSADMVANAFFAHAPVNIKMLQRRVQQVHEAPNDEARQEIVVELYLAVHSLASEASLAKLQTFFQLSSAMETLLKKWIGESKGPATLPLSLVAGTLDLLHDFCDAKLTANWAEEPIRILVVGDEPTARKNLQTAIQLPSAGVELSETGEAIKFATEKHFDVILLNVQAASPDTLSFCSKLRERCKNRTPIVCVSDEANLEILRESTLSGGFHLIQRSIASEELSLAALTFALVGRLERTTPAHNVIELGCASQVEELAAVAK